MSECGNLLLFECQLAMVVNEVDALLEGLPRRPIECPLVGVDIGVMMCVVDCRPGSAVHVR